MGRGEERKEGKRVEGLTRVRISRKRQKANMIAKSILMDWVRRARCCWGFATRELRLVMGAVYPGLP